jgi:hypothetical protein
LPTRTRPAWSGRARPSGRRRADPKAWPAHADTPWRVSWSVTAIGSGANRRGSIATGETTAHDRANRQAMTGRLGNRNVDGKSGRRSAGGPRRTGAPLGCRIVACWAVELSPAVFDHQPPRPVARLFSAQTRAGFTAAELRDILDGVIEVDAQLRQTGDRQCCPSKHCGDPHRARGTSRANEKPLRCLAIRALTGIPQALIRTQCPPGKLARPGILEQIGRASIFMNLSGH